MPPQLPNENTVKERYECYDALITVTTVRNVKIKKTNKQQNNIQKPEKATLRMKAEANETNTQMDIKIYHNSHSNRTGETNCTNSQAKKMAPVVRCHPTHPPILLPGLCFCAPSPRQPQ